MNFFTKTKFLIAVIIILSAIVLSIFGTLGYHHYKTGQRENKESKEYNESRENAQPGMFMAKQLKLSPEQIKEFDSLREKFHSETNKLIKESKDISRAIMEEIVTEKPDIAKLKSLAEKFGKLQEQQKQMMIDHLLEIKGKCSESQQVNFNKLLRQMENHERMNGERRRNNEGRERN